MSAHYCVAMALKHRGATLAALAEWDDPTIAALLVKIEVLADPRLPELGARLELQMADGARHESELRPGSDDLPGWDGVVAAVGRLGGELPDDGRSLDRLVDATRRLEELGDIGLLAAAVAGVAEQAGETKGG